MQICFRKPENVYYEYCSSANKNNKKKKKVRINPPMSRPSECHNPPRSRTFAPSGFTLYLHLMLKTIATTLT